MVVGAIGVAEESDAMWFGTQASQSALAPANVVANQVYQWDVVLKDVIQMIADGTYGGTSFVINLANGGEVMDFNADYNLPADVKSLALDTIKGIIDGTIIINLGD
jgi:basic membrane protein A